MPWGLTVATAGRYRLPAQSDLVQLAYREAHAGNEGRKLDETTLLCSAGRNGTRRSSSTDDLLGSEQGKGHTESPGTDERVRVPGSPLKAANFGESSKLKPGKTRFVFNNKGDFPHNFTIVYLSEGATQFNSATLNGGKKQRRTINLKAGSYLAVCTVGNGAHSAAGMFINFTVGAQSGETFQWGS